MIVARPPAGGVCTGSAVYSAIEPLQPIAHFDAMARTTLGRTGSLVDSWTSIDGKYSFTASGGDRPTYQATGMDGNPAVDFTASDVMRANALAPLLNGEDRPFAVFMVCEMDVLQNNDILTWGSSTDADPLLIVRQTATQYSLVKRQDSGGTAPAAVGGVTNTAVHVYSARTDAAGQNVTIAVDGFDLATGSVDTGVCTFDVLALGARDSNGSVTNNTNGRIGELIIFYRAVSDAEASFIHSYLLAKWGLVCII